MADVVAYNSGSRSHLYTERDREGTHGGLHVLLACQQDHTLTHHYVVEQIQVEVGLYVQDEVFSNLEKINYFKNVKMYV